MFKKFLQCLTVLAMVTLSISQLQASAFIPRVIEPLGWNPQTQTLYFISFYQGKPESETPSDSQLPWHEDVRILAYDFKTNTLMSTLELYRLSIFEPKAQQMQSSLKDYAKQYQDLVQSLRQELKPLSEISLNPEVAQQIEDQCSNRFVRTSNAKQRRRFRFGCKIALQAEKKLRCKSREWPFQDASCKIQQGSFEIVGKKKNASGLRRLKMYANPFQSGQFLALGVFTHSIWPDAVEADETKLLLPEDVHSKPLGMEASVLLMPKRSLKKKLKKLYQTTQVLMGGKS